MHARPHYDTFNQTITQVLCQCFQVANRFLESPNGLGKVNLYTWYKKVSSLPQILCIQVKQLIRRAKAWRNIHWKDSKEGKPKLYCLSILVIIAYDRLPPEREDLNDWFPCKCVLRDKNYIKSTLDYINHQSSQFQILYCSMTRTFMIKALIKEIGSDPYLK